MGHFSPIGSYFGVSPNSERHGDVAGDLARGLLGVLLVGVVVVQDGGHDRSPCVEEPNKRAAVRCHVMLPCWAQYTASTQKDH